MKIVLTDAGTVTGGDLDLSVFEKFGEATVYDITTPELTAARIKDADIVLCNKTVLGENELKDSRVKYIGLFATGYNNIDTAYTDAHGITVCNAGQYSTEAVAQQVFAYILGHASRTAEYGAFTAGGGWVKSKFFSVFSMPTHEIYGRTIGIIGFGSIGKKVATIALAFGMKVLVCTRTVRQTDLDVTFTDFDTLVASSDYITVHTPLTKQTARMFDKAAFGKCKRGAFFINTSRGGTVDEQALRDALESGILCGAAVDVLTNEPMRADCPLLGAPDLTITPHIAWAPFETRVRLIGIVEDNIKAWIDGKPKNVVH